MAGSPGPTLYSAIWLSTLDDGQCWLDSPDADAAEIKETNGQTKSSCTVVLWKHLRELALQDPPRGIASLIPQTQPTEPESGGNTSAHD